MTRTDDAVGFAQARVLVCGSRSWDDETIIDVVVSGLVKQFELGLTVIHGGARGADALAAESAALDQQEGRQVEVLAFSADWNKQGRAAGPIRNQRMLDEGRPTMVIAFTDSLADSRGTRDMVTRATRAGIPTYIVSRAHPDHSDA